MRKISPYIIILILLLSWKSYAQNATETSKEELHWMTDIIKAQEVSANTKRPIFAFFTGSDWCGWCRKLQNDVFSKPSFVNWANSNVVLVELDFPRRKQLPEELVRQNTELQQVFRVSGFPTIWMFYLNKDDESKKLTISALGRLGYPQNATEETAAAKFLDSANEVLSKNGGD